MQILELEVTCVQLRTGFERPVPEQRELKRQSETPQDDVVFELAGRIVVESGAVDLGEEIEINAERAGKAVDIGQLPGTCG